MTEEKLSKAKQIILSMLWNMEWVDGADIFSAVHQTYYDRRIRELRESGWQIQTSGKKYRLVSREQQTGNIRRYPSAKQKHQVLTRDKGICQICGSRDTHIQFDHKVPQGRQGKTEFDNLQLLCRSCNVEKRGVCKRCVLVSCDGCPYAFPELFSGRFIVMLEKPLTEKISAEAQRQGISESSLIAGLIEQHYGL